MAVLGAGFVLLPLTRDAAPMAARSQFLAAFRLLADGGTMAGPFLLGAVVAATSLAPAILVMGAVGWLSSAALGRWVPRPPDPDLAPG